MAKAAKPAEPEVEELGLHESRNALFAGATVSDIAILFRRDRREVTSKIVGNVRPVGKRGKVDTYLIRDVAPYFVKFVGDIETHIRNMRPEDLPPKLQKAYYDGLKGKIDYQLREGQVWHQDKIIEVFSAAAKIIRSNLLLLPEEIGRQTELTEDQKTRLRGSISATIQKMQDSLFEHFQKPEDSEPKTTDENASDAPSAQVGEGGLDEGGFDEEAAAVEESIRGL